MNKACLRSCPRGRRTQTRILYPRVWILKEQIKLWPIKSEMAGYLIFWKAPIYNCSRQPEEILKKEGGAILILRHRHLILGRTRVLLIRKLVRGVAFHLLTSELWHEGPPPSGQVSVSQVKRVWINQQVLYPNAHPTDEDGLIMSFTSPHIQKYHQVKDIFSTKIIADVYIFCIAWKIPYCKSPLSSY